MSILREHLDYTWPVGKSDRFLECDTCEGRGNSKAVQITRKEDGFLWHCFRCDRSGFFSDEQASPDEVQALDKARSKAPVNTRPEVVTLPDDYTRDLPPKAAVWLYDMELDPEDIEAHEIGWSPGHKRIIVPVYKYIYSAKVGKAKKLVGVQGRKLPDDDTDKPKWSTTRQRDIKHPRFISPGDLSIKKVVLVENVFSAIKITKFTGFFAIALLTSYLPYELHRPLARYDHTYIWLDPDAYQKSVKYQMTLGSAGVTSTPILSPQKPKDTPSEILKKLLGVDNGDVDNHYSGDGG
jgi:hypothetical protein